MLQPYVLKFLSALNKNNNKPWFDKHRNEFEEAKANHIVFVEALIKEISKFDPAIASLNAKDCIFRINRDVRFSKDKRPYKNNMGAYFNKAGKKGAGAGYYVHIEPQQSFAAGGLWMPEPKDLLSIRQEIDYNFPEWKKIISAASFKKHFPRSVESEETLSRPPKGYTDDNPAIGFLKMKSFVVSKPFTDSEVTDKNFIKKVAEAFRMAKPMNDFINAALD